MPYSTRLRNSTIPQEVEKVSIELGKKLKILDVGAGAGKRADLLKQYYDVIDAVEIREPYIEEFQLHEKYNRVILSNVMDIDFTNMDYDLVILGDIFEHLSVADAKELLERLEGFKVFIMVPFNTPQGECYGNMYEEHLQPDLSEDVMAERYPELEVGFISGRFGFYILN